MAVEFTESAGEHGFVLEDAIHAIENATYAKAGFEPSRIPGHAEPDLYIGPAKDGRIIEVMTEVSPPRTLVIFHAMEVRQKTLNKLIRKRKK